MKVCTCLNPLHTALAVYGCLLGYDLISSEMKDKELLALITRIGYVEGLPVGNYKLKEIIAPEGYQKTEQMVDFSVKADGSTKNVVMTNEVVSVNVPNTMRNVSVFMYIFGFTLVIVSTVVLLYKENKLPKRLTNIFKRK